MKQEQGTVFEDTNTAVEKHRTANRPKLRRHGMGDCAGLPVGLCGFYFGGSE